MHQNIFDLVNPNGTSEKIVQTRRYIRREEGWHEVGVEMVDITTISSTSSSSFQK